jgi:hypothetical protein
VTAVVDCVKKGHELFESTLNNLTSYIAAIADECKDAVAECLSLSHSKQPHRFFELLDRHATFFTVRGKSLSDFPDF